MTAEQKAKLAIEQAALHVGRDIHTGRAQTHLHEARRLQNLGLHLKARWAALASLQASVGIQHPAYLQAAGFNPKGTL